MVKRKREKHHTTSNELVSPTSTDKRCVNIDVKKPYKKKLHCWTKDNTENLKLTSSKPLTKTVISKEHIIAHLSRHAGTNTSDTVHHKPGTVVQLHSNNKFQSSNTEQKRQNSLSTLDNQKEELTQKNIKDARLIPRIKEYLGRRSDESFVSIPHMVDYLRIKYPEYGRRKWSYFKNYVITAYWNLKLPLNLKKNDESETNVMNTPKNGDYKFKKPDDTDPEVCDESDISFKDLDAVTIAAKVDDHDLGSESHEDDTEMMEELVEYKDFNAINSMLSNLYKDSPTSPFILECDKKQDRTSVSGVAKPKQDNAVQVDPMQTTPAATYFDGCPTVKKGNRVTIANMTMLSSDKSDSRERSVQKISDNLDAKISDGLCTTKDRFSMLHKFCDDDIGDHIGIEDAGISDGPTQFLLTEHSMKIETEMANTNKQILSKSNDDKRDCRIRKSTVKRQSDKTEDVAKISKKRKTGSRNQQQADSDTEQSKKEKGPQVQKSTVKFSDVGGNEDNLIEISTLLSQFSHPEFYQEFERTTLRGILFHGPPGCGKTLLVNAIAGELDLPLINIGAPEIVSGVSGESEENIRDLFEKAAQTAPCILFIDEIDAIASKRETASKDMEKRIVTQLFTCFDALNANANCRVLVIGATNRPDALDPGLRRTGRFDKEICLGVPDESSRLKFYVPLTCDNIDDEMCPWHCLGDDKLILQVLCRNYRFSRELEFSYIARNTPGYVGADLAALATEAIIVAVKRVCHKFWRDENVPKCAEDSGSVTKEIGNMEIVVNNGDIANVNAALVSVGDTTMEQCNAEIFNSAPVAVEHLKHMTLKAAELSVWSWFRQHPPWPKEQLKDFCITLDDIKAALKRVQPSTKREGFATVPDMSWDDIGALKDVKMKLDLSILGPVRQPELFAEVGLTRALGVMLTGPPGCGKTLLAKAMANEAKLNFISVKGPELLSMYVGESERAIRTVFERARNSAPCLIFFDEFDALGARRSGSSEGNSSARVVNQMLTEMDGLEQRKQVFIIAATNRPEIIDPAILRPGRLDKTIYVDLPTVSDRLDILKCLTKNGTHPQLSPDVDLARIAADPRCDGYTGADLYSLVTQASENAVACVYFLPRTQARSKILVNRANFEAALESIEPSVSNKNRKRFCNRKKKRSR